MKFFLRNLLIGPKARVLHYSELEMLFKDKHSILSNPFTSYAKMKCLNTRQSGLHETKLPMLACDKHSSIMLKIGNHIKKCLATLW
jgi:hypothetical protein